MRIRSICALKDSDASISQPQSQRDLDSARLLRGREKYGAMSGRRKGISCPTLTFRGQSLQAYTSLEPECDATPGIRVASNGKPSGKVEKTFVLR